MWGIRKDCSMLLTKYVENLLTDIEATKIKQIGTRNRELYG